MQKLYRNSMFLLLMGGQGISILGDRIYSIALMWYIIEQTGSALSLGMSVISMTLPAIIFMPWAGVLADKNWKKEIILISDVAKGIVMLILMFLVTNEEISMIAINICLIVVSSINAFFSPALSAALPLIVDRSQLTKANAVFQFIQQFSNILGPALGGILIAFLSAPMLFAINAASLFIAAFFSWFLTIPNVEEEEEREESFFHRFKEGVRYTLGTKRLLFLILVGGVIINFFLAPLHIFLVVITNQILQVGSMGLGWIESAISVGALLGSLIILSGAVKNQIRLAIFGLVMEGGALIAAGIFMNLTSLILFFGLLGMGVCFASIGIRTAFQLMVEENKMGRVMSFLSMLATSTVPIGTFVGSILVEAGSISTIFISFGIIVAVSGLSLFLPFKNEFRKSSKYKSANA